MSNANLRGVVCVAVFASAMSVTGQEPVLSLNLCGFNKASEITGTVMVASTFKKDSLAFTDTGMMVKLHNVTYAFMLPQNYERIQYCLPGSLTLDGIEIGGKSVNLTTNTFDGPFIHITRDGVEGGLATEPVIVYFTLPSGTNAVQCRLIVTDTHLALLANSNESDKNPRPGEQQVRGYSPPAAARSSKPTP